MGRCFSVDLFGEFGQFEEANKDDLSMNFGKSVSRFKKQ